MALFRRFFYRKPPDRLLEISERTYVFDCCFSTDVLDEDEYKIYLGGIVAQLQDCFPDASFMVFNFRGGVKRSQICDVLSQYDMTVMDYPQQYESCPLLPLEMIHHFLRSCECWLALEGQQNVLLMHCERGGWPVLAFMLAGLLLYRNQYNGEQKTLEMVYKQAPRELLHLLSPLNPQPSQLRYLRYISRRETGSDWPPSDSPVSLDCVILRVLPLFDGIGGRGCRPLVRIYGLDPSSTSDRRTKLLFSTLRTEKHSPFYRPEQCTFVKIDIHQHVQGDVVLECLHLNDDFAREEMVFRIMFHTAFIRSNVLMLTRDEVDVLWDAKDLFPRDFRAEVLFSDAASEDGTEFESALQPKPGGSGARGKLEEGENKPDQEGISVQKKIDRQGSQPKLGGDAGKQKSEKAVTSTSRKQSISSTKSAADAGGPKLKLKQQDSRGSQLRQAKANAVSRWIPPNEGFYFDSMHVSRPPSRQNSVPWYPPSRQNSVISTIKTEPCPVLFSDAASVDGTEFESALPEEIFNNAVASEDGTKTESASPKKIFDVEEIFNNTVDEKVHNVAHISTHRMSVAGSPDIGEMVVSLTDEDETIISRLMRGSSKRDIVSIVGMGGIGKTTLAKKVYNDPKIAYHFHRRAWCSVSQVYGKRELLLDIIKDIHGLPDEILQMTDADLELKLFQKLKTIRYLIVMDDVWDIQAFKVLERSFPDDGAGSRILITSRFRDVALEAKPDSNPHMLRPLSDDESWNLLEMKSFPKGGGCPEELVEIGKEIARQCEGLPLAVVAVAGILRRTENKHNDWEKIAESLRSRIIADPETQCKVILELSYMHLPIHLKVCFLYFGAFSENKEVPVSKLIRLWIAEGFIENNEAKSLEDIAEDFLMDLINGSLVMISKRRSNGRVNACFIHGLLHDLCLSKAQEDNFLQLISRNDEPYASFDLFDYGSDFYDFYPSDPVTYESQRLCIYLKRKHFVHSRPSGPCTTSLIFSACSDTYPRRLYNVSFMCHHFKILKVLDLECINMGMFLPSEIELLVQLRYLAVSGDMDSISRSIANLRLLETFIVKGLSGKVILPDTIWCMTSLRHLHVNSYAVFSLPDDQTESSFLLDNLVSLSLP